MTTPVVIPETGTNSSGQPVITKTDLEGVLTTEVAQEASDVATLTTGEAAAQAAAAAAQAAANQALATANANAGGGGGTSAASAAAAAAAAQTTANTALTDATAAQTAATQAQATGQAATAAVASATSTANQASTVALAANQNVTTLTGTVAPVTLATAYGADPTGAADSTAAINEALAYAATVGHDVVLTPGIYVISGTLNLGSGTASSVSTYGSPRLRGLTGQISPAQFGFNVYTAASSTNSVRLRWSGATGGTMISVNGPVQDWGVENLHLEGVNQDGSFASGAGYGLKVVSGQFGKCKNLTVENCAAGIYLTTVLPFTQTGNLVFCDSYRNTFENTLVAVPYLNGAKAIVLTGALNSSSQAQSNTDYAYFYNTQITMPTAASGSFTGSAYGLYMQACDTCVFHGLQFFNHGPISFPIVFDYTTNGSWPSACDFYNVDWGPPSITPAPVITTGSIGTTSRPNHIYAISEANGSIFPESRFPVPNLNFATEYTAPMAILSVTGAYPTSAIITTYAAGMYRLVYYLSRTGGNAVGGNFYYNFMWHDGSQAQQGQSAGVSADTTGAQWVSGSMVMYSAAGSDISFNTSFNAPSSGATQYAMHLLIEKLGS